MALFGKKPKAETYLPGVIHTEDEILGYLDEVYRQHQPLSIQTKDSHWKCSIYFIDVKKKSMRIEDSPGLSENKDKPVLCGFSLDRTWFIFQSRLAFREGKPYLIMPSAIKHQERRSTPRVALFSRENVRVSVLQSLGRGIGITGLATDVSLGGLSLTIERALRLENEQILSLHRDLLPKGTELMLVKVNYIPKVPPFETSAVVHRIARYKDWKLAIEFPKLSASIKASLEQFIESRYLPYNPVNRSYQRRLEMEKEREKLQQSAEANLLKPVIPPGNELDAAFTLAEPGPVPAPHSEKDRAIKATIDLLDEIEISLPQEMETPQKPMLLSLGDELKESLAFLETIEGYEWLHVETPMKILKSLRERKIAFLLLPPLYKEQSMLEYLEKISHMGVLAHIGIIMIAAAPLSPKDLVKCRMLGIKHTIQLPLLNPGQIKEIISSANSALPGTPAD